MKYILIILLLFSVANAGQVTIGSGDLPYTASSNDTITFTGTKITSATNGITINFGVTGVIVDFSTDTLEFGTGGGDNNYGISIDAGTNSVIKNGLILHDSTSTGDGNNCMIIKRGRYLTVQNVDMTVYGTNAKCISGSYSYSPGHLHVEIDSGTYKNLSTGYTSRCSYDGAVMKWGFGENDTTYAIYVHDVTISNGGGQGIAFASAGKIKVSKNTITLDSRNDTYSYPSGNACYGNANAYGILMRDIAAGSICDSNTIRSDSTYGGSRGILIENSQGTSDSTIKIFDNDVKINEGYDDNYGEGYPTFGFRLRTDGGDSIKYVDIYNNTVWVLADSDATTIHTKKEAVAMFMSVAKADAYIRVYNNNFRAYRATNGTPDSCITMAVKIAGNEGVLTDSSIIWHDNKLESDGILMWFDDPDNGATSGLTGVTFIEDTLDYLNTLYSHYTYVIRDAGWGNNTDSVFIRDFIYLDNNIDTIIDFRQTSGAQDLTLQKTVNLFVMTPDSVAIQNAICSVLATPMTDTVLIFVDTTDASGNASGIVNYWYESRTATDTTTFNDFHVKAWSGSNADSNMALTVTWNLGTDTLTINNGELYQNNTTIDTTVNSFQVRTDFGNITGAVNWVNLYVSTSNPPVTLSDSVNSPADPYTWNSVTGLVENTWYFYRTIAQDGAYTDTSIVDSILLPIEKAPQFNGSMSFGGNLIIE